MHVKKGSFYITGPTSDDFLSMWKKAFPQINQLEGRGGGEKKRHRYYTQMVWLWEVMLDFLHQAPYSLLSSLVCRPVPVFHSQCAPLKSWEWAWAYYYWKILFVKLHPIIPVPASSLATQDTLWTLPWTQQHAQSTSDIRHVTRSCDMHNIIIMKS